MGDGARASEEQNQCKANHKGRRDDRDDRQHTQHLLGCEVCSGEDQSKGQTEQGGAETGGDTQQNRVDCWPTGATIEAAKPPDIRRKKAWEELGKRPATAVNFKGADQNMKNRIENEDADEGNDQADQANDKGVTSSFAHGGDASGQQKQHCQQGDHGACAKPDLSS